jgi:large subunit ribosomal protein L24
MSAIKKNDQVMIIAGKDKGKTGRVIFVFPEKEKIVVEGLNLVKKAKRRTRQDEKGGIIDIESPIHVSNVMLVCPGCGKHTRTGHANLPDGTKARACRRCNTTFEN